MTAEEETESMEDALAAAREAPREPAGFDATLKQLDEWDMSPPEETPTKETGDTKSTRASKAEAPEPPKEEWGNLQHRLRTSETSHPEGGSLPGLMREAGWSPAEAHASPDWEQLGEHLEGEPQPEAAEHAPLSWEELRTALPDEPASPAAATPERKPPEWGELGDQLAKAEHDSDTMSTIGAMLHASAPGFVLPPNVGHGNVEAAKAAIEAEKNRRASEEQDRKHSQELLAAERKLAASKPGTPEAKRAAEKARALLAEHPELTPKSLDEMSADEVEKFIGEAQPRMASLSAEKVARSKTEAEATEKAAKAAAEKEKLDKAAADTAKSLVDERAMLLKDPRAKLAGLTPEMVDGLDRHGLDKAWERIATLKAPKGGAGTHPAVHITPHKIETVPERRAGYRDLVKGIAEGRLEAPKPGGRFGAELVSDVLAYKPDFDATKFAAYNAVKRQQATGKDIVAIDVAREHMRTAKSLIPKNADLQWVNRVKQAVASGAGDPEFKPFIAASGVAAHELAKVYGIEDQAGKAMVERQMEAAQSPEQLAAVFDTFDELIAGKQHGIERQLEKVAPGEPPPPQPDGEKKDHGAVAKETKSFRRYADGFIERK